MKVTRCNWALGLLCAIPILSSGCMKALYNSWLEPGAVGEFSHEGTQEIRSTLSIQESPLGVAGATDPTPDDLVPIAQEYRFGPGDSMEVRILDLLARSTETNVQITVNEIGQIRLPVVGVADAAGLTARELENEIADILAQRDVLRQAEVVIQPLVRRNASVVIFGAIANPNLYPLPRPDYRLLEAINVAGGLIDSVNEIYVYRKENSPLDGMNGGQSLVPQIDLETQPAPVTLAGGFDGGGGMGGSRAYQDPEPPTADSSATPAEDQGLQDAISAGQEARLELIEAIAPAATQPTSQDVDLTESAEQTLEPPQSRWVFLNGKWIEVGPTPATSESASTIPADTQRAQIEFPDLPQPSVDWSQIAGEPRNRVIRISADALRDGDPRQNIVVRPGDTIRLMAGQSGEYYMMGQIARPGAYGLSGRQVTLKTAIAAAGNLGPLAWPERCTVYRRLGDREEMIQVNVDRIFTGQDPDFYLKKDDLIVFGTHPASIFFAVLRNAFRLTYGFGFVYDRNFADVDITEHQVKASAKAQREAQPRFQGLLP